MPHKDDTDRFCPVCHGTRRLVDTATHEYGYSAFSSATCWACYVPAEPTPIPRKDDLIDAEIAKLAAAEGMTPQDYRAREYAEFHGEDA